MLASIASPLIAAATPAWVWATLLMTGFVALSIATMALTRIAVKKHPEDDDRAGPAARPPRPPA